MGTTTNYGWEYPDDGNDPDTWGAIGEQLHQDIDATVKEVDTRAGYAAPTGAVMDFFRTTPPDGWLWLNGQTIGNASSGADYDAADAEQLFYIVWLTASNAICPVYTSGGSTTTRGADHFADWAANKRIKLVDQTDRFRRSYKPAGSSAAIGASQSEMVGQHTHNISSLRSSSLRGDSSALDSFSGGISGSTYATQNNSGTENRPANIAYLTCIKL